MSTEYGIFQSIIEGDQAEAYKKKKDEEHRKEFNANKEREDRRHKAGEDKSDLDGALRNSHAEYMAHSHMKKTGRKDFGSFVSAKDAANRHLRRHPELNESSIEFI